MLREHDRDVDPTYGGEAGRVLERPTHQAVVVDARTVVGEHAHPERGHLSHRRQALSCAPLGDGAGDPHVARRRPAQLEDVTHNCSVGDGRLGVGHRHQRREAAERRRS